MKTSSTLTQSFQVHFENLISKFAFNEGFLPETSSLQSSRFLRRSVVPHIQRLSSLFNRKHQDDLQNYWSQSSHASNQRLAYFLYFMPTYICRVASLWEELYQLGFRWPHQQCRGIELGAGPATGLCGIAAGEFHSPIGLPHDFNTDWALIEKDRPLLELGERWAKYYTDSLNLSWKTRTFHRKITLEPSILPPKAPQFHLWLMSYFLNEWETSSEEQAQLLFTRLLEAWKRHLSPEGFVLLIDPALKTQSRKLLELRKRIIQEGTFQILLPCLGHQTCGALKNPDDWCHEEISWWRPAYLKAIDQFVGLDHKTLPFSYLIFTNSKKPIEEILPALKKIPVHQRERIVSPPFGKTRTPCVYACGQQGKRKIKYSSTSNRNLIHQPLERGDVVNLKTMETIKTYKSCTTTNPATQGVPPVEKP